MRTPVSKMRLTSGFGMRAHPILQKRRRHLGIDIAGAAGTPIHAAAGGTVIRARHVGGYGNLVEIDHGGEVRTRYAHLSAFAAAEGGRVEQGAIIGFMGSTGRSTGTHLHYELRVGGRAIDPRGFDGLAGDRPIVETTEIASRRLDWAPDNAALPIARLK